MRLRPEDVRLAARKALIGRLLRTRLEAGALGEEQYLTLRGRIEQAQTRSELDALQAEVERI